LNDSPETVGAAGPLDDAVPFEHPEQSERRRLGQFRPARELGHTDPDVRVFAEGLQNTDRFVDGSTSVAVARGIL
jgi:hypothetical protein